MRALAVSPDGKTLATCGNDHLVKLWSIPDGKLLRDARGPRLPRLQRRLSSRRQVAGLRRPARASSRTGTWRRARAVRELDAKRAVQVRHDVPRRHRRRPQHGLQRRRQPAGLRRHHQRDQRLRRHRQPAGRALRLGDGQAQATAAAEGGFQGTGWGVASPSGRLRRRGRRRQRRGAVVLEAGRSRRRSTRWRCPTTPATWTCTPTAGAWRCRSSTDSCGCTTWGRRRVEGGKPISPKNVLFVTLRPGPARLCIPCSATPPLPARRTCPRHAIVPASPRRSSTCSP